MQYMRAHGNTPGPTQRPVLAGALTGFIAEIPAVLVLLWSGGLTSATESLGVPLWASLALHSLATVAAGAIYGRVFSRAANDPQAGWLFGISYGFLIWIIGPVTVLQWTLGRPLALGVAAMGIFAGHLIYGLTLGLLYPWIHRLLQFELDHMKEPAGRGTFGVKTQAR